MSDIASETTSSAMPPAASETLAMKETNWDFLDEKDTSMIQDTPDEFEEDEAEGAKDETAKDEKPDAPVAGDEVKPEPTAETEKKPEPEIPAEVKAQIDTFNVFDQALKNDPASVAKAVFEGMDARQKATFLQEIGVAETQYPEFNLDEYEPGSSEAMEADLKARYQDIRSIPHLVAENRALDGRIGEVEQDFKKAFEGILPYVSEPNVMSELALAKIDAICEAMGIVLPDPDFDAVGKEIRPGVTYRDAVRKVVNYGTAVELAKQANAKRPLDTKNESKREKLILPTDDAVTIAKKLGTIPRR